MSIADTPDTAAPDVTLEDRLAQALWRMVLVHGESADDLKGTADWCRKAKLAEEEARDVLAAWLHS